VGRGSSFASRAVFTSAPTLDFRLREFAHIKQITEFRITELTQLRV